MGTPAVMDALEVRHHGSQHKGWGRPADMLSIVWHLLHVPGGIDKLGNMSPFQGMKL